MSSSAITSPGPGTTASHVCRGPTAGLLGGESGQWLAWGSGAGGVQQTAQGLNRHRSQRAAGAGKDAEKPGPSSTTGRKVRGAAAVGRGPGGPHRAVWKYIQQQSHSWAHAPPDWKLSLQPVSVPADPAALFPAARQGEGPVSIGRCRRNRTVQTDHACCPASGRKEILTAATWKDLEDAVCSTRPEAEGQTLGDPTYQRRQRRWGTGAGARELGLAGMASLLQGRVLEVAAAQQGERA